MYKVYVVFFGLIALVPSKNNSHLSALLLNTTGHMTSLGLPLDHPRSHTARYKFNNREAAGATFATLSLSLPGTGLDLKERSNTPDLVEVLGGEVAAAVRSECDSESVLRDCKYNDKELVAATSTLSGPWTLRAIDIVKRVPQNVWLDRTMVGFKSLAAEGGTAAHGRFERRLASGFLFTATGKVASDFTASVDSRDRLAPLTRACASTSVSPTPAPSW
jgi:hypothetical protein